MILTLIKPISNRLKSDKCGTSAIEFALVSPVLFAMIGGIISISIFAYDAYQFDVALREAVRTILIQDIKTVTAVEAQLYASVANAGLTIDHFSISLADLSNTEMAIGFSARMDFSGGGWFGAQSLFSHSYDAQISIAKMDF